MWQNSLCIPVLNIFVGALLFPVPIFQNANKTFFYLCLKLFYHFFVTISRLIIYKASSLVVSIQFWVKFLFIVMLLQLHLSSVTCYSPSVIPWPVKNLVELAYSVLEVARGKILILFHLPLCYYCRCASDSVLAFGLRISLSKKLKMNWHGLSCVNNTFSFMLLWIKLKNAQHSHR